MPAGSSPRGQGKQARVGATVDGYGLIPARAGKTAIKAAIDGYTPAHPHVGGENQGSSDTRVLRPGSSPRGRGKPVTIDRNHGE